MRVPLHIKLVISYLLVVGLALIPTAVYLRTSLEREQVARVRQQLAQDLVSVCRHLTQGDTTSLVTRAAALRVSLTTRVTVVTPRGEVIADSERPGVSLPSHADRPEIQRALQLGVGAAERVSSTTGRRLLYVARRCPERGAPIAIVRLAARLDGIERGREKIEAVLRNAGAVALSASVLLGLVAALAAVRPLRRIASAARAIAEGDLGTSLDVKTGDEIEDVAVAINAVVAMLRDRLVSAGAERATTQALLDELPVGVIVYDRQRQPLRINPAARRLCAFSPSDEAVRAAELASMSSQRAASGRAEAEARAVSSPLSLPWHPDAPLVATWVRVYDDSGDDLAAVVIRDAAGDQVHAALRAALGALRAALEARVARTQSAEEAKELQSLIDMSREALGGGELGAVEVGSLGELTEAARRSLGESLSSSRLRVTGEGVEVALADRGERIRDALALLLRWAAEREGPVELRTHREGAVLRVSARGLRASAVPAPARASLREIGGDAGAVPGEDHEERWISAPLA